MLLDISLAPVASNAEQTDKLIKVGSNSAKFHAGSRVILQTCCTPLGAICPDLLSSTRSNHS